MLYCNDCESIFDEEELVSGKEHIMEHYYMDTYTCPHCGSDNIEDAERCPLCGEYHAPHRPGDEADVCPECRKKIDKGIAGIIEQLPGERNEIIYQIGGVLDSDY